jgi:hypothetical protein
VGVGGAKERWTDKFEGAMARETAAAGKVG